MSLRDWLLSSLKTLPGRERRELDLHVLVSSARKHNELYPFATPRPRTYRQDILVLLSERPLVVVVEGDEDEKKKKEKRVLSVGIEANVYYIPSTSSGVLYISKVDTSGHGGRPSGARALVKGLVMYYCQGHGTAAAVTGGGGGGTTTRIRQMWVHVFARAQGQYLFPNSSEYEGKKPLSDVRLCGWWKSVLGEVGGEVKKKKDEVRSVKMWWVLPGYGELEAMQALGDGGDGGEWKYGHPYGEREIGLPCAAAPEGRVNLGHYIPSFEDDPKSRFMDEMAYTTEKEGAVPPSPKRARRGGDGDVKDARGVLGELGRVDVDEFWERMSFRQECVAGAVTGYFVVGVSGEVGGAEKGEGEGEGEVSEQVMKRVLKMMVNGVEYSNVERAERGTECVEGAIGGLCSGVYEEVHGRVVVEGTREEGTGGGKEMKIRELHARRKGRD